MLKDWRHKYSKICHINRYGKNKKGLFVSSFLVSQEWAVYFEIQERKLCL